MAILKCKMCGGTLTIEENSTVCECEYCGSRQTVPTVDDEKKVTLFERANRLRFNCEFDKAAAVYESIVADFKEEAEGYWGLVLCKYGIEYVDDPSSGKKVPTCHRSSFESVMEDTDFEMVMENADSISRQVYRDEAKQIEEIRKGIIEVSGKEQPYDIFICYKETAEDGQRTIDSVLAQDVYEALNDKGYRVFFSRITLEDKLGTEYEPYIFAALNSAKIMLAFGTKYDYYNAVWVKNEWSRYLKLMAADKSKHLIPCYKDIDAYDMPKEFARLQAQDLGKVGAVQDLLRGIEKIINPNGARHILSELSTSAGSNIKALLDRGFLALEDKEWNAAIDFFDNVLNQDAKCAEAYLGKLMAELNVVNRDCLKDQKSIFDDNNNYKKAYRFGDASIKELLDTATSNILYNSAITLMNSANSEVSYKEAAIKFERLNGFADSTVKAKECYARAETARRDAILEEGIGYKKQNTIEALEKAVTTLEQISDWKDAQSIIEECGNQINSIKDEMLIRAMGLQKEDTIGALEKSIAELKTISGWKNADDLRMEVQRRINALKESEEQERRDKERISAIEQAKKKKRFIIFSSFIVVATIGILVLVTKVIIPANDYRSAVALKNYGEYEKAIEAFKDMGNYKDAATQIEICQEAIVERDYNIACDLMDNGEYNAAMVLFANLNEYKNSVILLKYTKIKLIGEASVGEVVTFGDYYGNDEWIVLEKKDEELLLLSRHAIDTQPYTDDSDSWRKYSWKNCSLRKWLNENYFNTAFDLVEQTVIVSKTIQNEKRRTDSSVESASTKDKIFLLSESEVEKYLSSERLGKMGTREKTLSDETTSVWWWLRSRGYTDTDIAFVTSDGRVQKAGRLGTSLGGVCPAMWIDISNIDRPED